MNEFPRSSSRRKFGGGGNRRRRSVLDDGYPTEYLLLAAGPPDLTENKLLGSYKSVSEYRDIHFDLLLEDCICPLREALAQFKRNKNSRSLNGARVCHNVKLDSLKVHGNQITCMMDVDQLKVNVEPSFGCLIVFTKKNFNDGFFIGTVISDTTKTGVSAVQLRLKFFKGSKVKLYDVHTHSFIMIEGQVFFYVYFHVLKALNLLHENNFPMKQYIVYGNKETCVRHPAYLTQSTRYKISDHDVSVLSDSKWPSSKDLKMNNESQYNALKRALTEEIALIQGPPGTGKTYFGVSLVKVLLDNDSVWNPSGTTPLLIVCQSNEALDHFLEKLLTHTNKLVRIGDQCQNPKLKSLSLKELVCRHVHGIYAVDGLNTHLERLDKTRERIKHLVNGIVSFKVLKQYGVIREETSDLFNSEDDYLEWLGLHVKAELKCSNQSDTDLLVSITELLKHIDQFELSGEYLLSVTLRKDLALLKNLTENFKISSREEVKWSDSTLLSLPPHDAQNVYLSWLDKYFSKLGGILEVLEDGFDIFWQKLLKVERHIAIMHVLRSAKVVGLTSTGAASRNLILQDLKAPIVIIEEAGELLESHVVVSMTEHCQHLIMMGDHKQLKPGITTHHLAEDFNLNVSLFERLLRNEVVTSTALTTQYRMKPEISALLKPFIYSILDDGPGTTGRPPVRGISKSVFFIDHEEMELKTADNTGCWNPHEVGMLINLANYLVSQMDYAPKDITIISMYGEQKKKLIEARDKIPALANLPIASVDSYQGKENEIILLSLVRSNKTGNIGFLKEENRVCVALSRARIGLYIVGNIKCLTKGSKMWTFVSQKLLQQRAIGTKLILSCDKHETVRYVAKEEDWSKTCFRCLEDLGASKSKTGVKPAKSFEPITADILSNNRKNTRCTCCKSFYCHKARDSLKLDHVLASAFKKLTLAQSP